MATNGPGLVDRMGAWARRRTEPRLWVTLAGAGCLLAVFGILVISGDAQAGDNGDGSTAPGIILCLLVVAAGYVLMYRFTDAPAGSAGVAAVALGLPPLMFFMTFDENGIEPVSIEALLGIPAAVWIVSYLVGPGKGRPLLLGAGLVFAWLFALQVIVDPLQNGIDTGTVFEDPFGPADEPFSGDEFDEDQLDDEFSEDDFDEDFGSGDSFGQESGDSGDQTTAGVVSLLFGGGYLFAVRLLDRKGYRGSGTPMVFAAHVALPTGIVLLGNDLETGGTGAAFLAAGLVTAWIGALGARRATTIIGAIEVTIGVVTLLGDAMETSDASSFGLALVVLGIAIAAAAHLLHIATGEPPQTTPGPSSFPGRPRPAPAMATFGAPAQFGAPAPGTAPWQAAAAPAAWQPQAGTAAGPPPGGPRAGPSPFAPPGGGPPPGAPPLPPPPPPPA
ncbi:MAG TPA: hypothetical protein VFI47_31240 [Acidimicrobiales bacterium]|nr:hypothetical protein [Acidimicrobiales bacterium]